MIRMKTSPWKFIIVSAVPIILTVALLTVPASGQELTGRRIMERALSGSTWDDMQAKLTLTLKTSRGETRVREIDFYSRDTNEEETRMLMRFTAPADVEGTGFLQIEHKNAGDERYLYLPALRRVKRIAASGSGGNFMSSDFTYYDIGSPELEDWTYTRLENATVEGQECYVLETFPRTDQIREDTGYGKVIRWITVDSYNTIRSEYYDQSMEKKKELTIPEYTQLKGTDFASRLIMHDVQIDHTSIMEFDDIEVDTGIPDDFFSQRYLQRMR